MERRTYTYYAFISYKHSDEKWARWIQRALETYRFPVAVRSEHHGLPKKIFPVFRDTTDLGGGVLEKELKACLEDSEYLIVLCSPESAKSAWVEQEVSYFQSLGRGEHIVPVIIDGEPHAKDSAQECFCPSLRSVSNEELLGVNVPGLGKRNAFLRVVATIMHLRYDDLVRRDKQRALHLRIMVGLAALILAAVGFGVYWYLAPHSHYYWSVAIRNQVPEGIVEMNKEERQHASGFYKLVTQRGRVVRLETVNALGILGNFIPYSDIKTYNCPVVEFAYTGDGELASASYMDRFGEPQMIERYDGLGAFNLINPQNASRIGDEELDDWGIPSAVSEVYNTDQQISRTLFELDAQGFAVEARYMRDNLNNPACDSSGIYGSSREYDPQGNILRMEYLDREEEPLCIDGASVSHSEYNERGQLTSVSYFDAQETPVMSGGMHRIDYTYDGNGNMVMIQYFDVDGDLCCGTALGISTQKMAYDEHGLLIEISVFNEQGEAAYSRDDGVHMNRYLYDSRCNLLQENFYDSNGDRMCNLCGVAEVRYAYDDRGREVERRYYGVDGEPAFWIDSEKDYGNVNTGALQAGADQSFGYGYGMNSAGVCTEYPDEHIERTTYLGEDGAPATCYNGYATLQRTYNADGLLERIDSFDPDGAPIRAMYNAASILYGYNAASRLKSVAYLDENGEPCASMFGAAQERIDYDSNGRATGIRYYDANGKPCWVRGSRDMFSQLQFEITDRGQVSAIRYYDPDGKLLEYGRIAETRRQYDARGNQTREAYFDAMGNPINNDDGVAGWAWSYDAGGRMIKQTCFDKDGGSPVDLFDCEEWIYDARGNILRYNYEWQSSEGQRKHAHTIYAYDARDNVIKETDLLDVDNRTEPIIISAIEYAYDAQNRIIRETKFGLNGTYESRYDTVVEYTYDECGKKIAEDYWGYDTDREELVYNGRIEFDYNAYGFLCERRSLDSEGKLEPFSDGYAIVIDEYDVMGNNVQRRWLDEHEEPFRLEEGYAEVHASYDAVGNPIEADYYDIDGTPMTRESGFPAHIQATYDTFGYPATVDAFDENGDPFQ